MKEALGNNVKYLRYKLNYTQEELAELLDISSTYLGYIENGKHNVSLDLIEKIALFFEVEPYTLFINNDYCFPKRIDAREYTSTLK